MTPHATPRPAEILLVEDNPGDARFTQEILREARLWHRLSLVTNGEEALTYLRRERHYTGATPPDLLLLDLHLPRKDGWEVHAEMRLDERLRRIPVAILAGLPEEWEQNGGSAEIACALLKPLDTDQISALVSAVASLGLLLSAPPDPCPSAASD
jgi:chemotaxis family two-component system response regulator Rcp1